MIQALLFDLDGTLVNSDPLHYQTWQESLLDYGIEINEAFYKQRFSRRLNLEIVSELLPKLSSETAQLFIEQRESLYRSRATQLQLLPGLSNLLTWASDRKLKLALVTNAPRKSAEFLLELLSLVDTFAQVVLAEDVTLGKPDPTPYQIALKNLRIPPAAAIAFEDSPSGIRSAVGAGILTVGIASTHEPNELYQNGAALVVPDFNNPQLWAVFQKDGQLLEKRLNQH